MPNYPRREGTRFNKDRIGGVACTDFTVQDFANSVNPGKVIRVKKGQLHNMSSPAKIVRNMQESTEDLPWYERDLTEFDLSPDEEVPQEESLTDTENQGSRHRHVRKPGKRGTSESSESLETGGVVYPADFWFLLADYIHPEDICVFALICQGSHVVIHTAGFWQRLYRRSCKHSENDSRVLPWDLQASHMDRVHGLRSRVIRYLFHVHPVFVERLGTSAPFQRDPDLLQGCSCSLMWYDRQRTNWLFNFKFVKRSQSRCRFVSHSALKSKNYRLSADDDIHVNDHEGSYVMQVVCPDFVSMPIPMGMVLTKASLSVGQGMTYHKLKLNFDQTYSGGVSSHGGGSDIALVIDPVLNLHVLPWWHPRYTVSLIPSGVCKEVP